MLALTLFLAVPVSASGEVTRGSAFFVSHCTYIYKTGGTNFQIWFEVMATAPMDELGVSYIQLQRSTDQTNWTPVKYYYPNSWGAMITENAQRYANCVTYNGFTGYYYRAYVTYYARSGNNVGYYDTYSDIIRL